MTAMPVLKQDGDLGDLVMEITARIERARDRSRRQHSTQSHHRPLFEDGQLRGVIQQPQGVPVFGPGAPTVLMRRETMKTGEGGTGKG